MPYIKSKKRREAITSLLYGLMDRDMKASDMVFSIFKQLKIFADMKGHRFITYCTIMGICVCTMLEFYRRVIAKYEDTKINENGDVL